MNSHDYSYCFLRYCQDRESGEFANIGVALWCPSERFLAFRGSHRFARLTHFFGELDKDGYRLLIEHIEKQFQKLSKNGLNDLISLPSNVSKVASRIVPEDDGSLLWSQPRGGLTKNPKADFEKIFQRFIQSHYEDHDSSRRDDDDVFRQVYRKFFAAPVVAERIKQHKVQAPLTSHLFKHAWKNGQWHVYEPLSLDLRDPDSIERKAHTWYSKSTHLKQAEDPPKLHFLLGRPGLRKNLDSYKRAKDILRSCSGVDLVEEDDAGTFGNDLQRKIVRSSH